MINLLLQPLQSKLSSLLGRAVTVDSFNVSLLGGSIEAGGITIAADGSTAPMLTVARVRAEIAVARAIKGEIVIKSLTIERPVLTIAQRADGSIDLPQRGRASSEATQSASDTADVSRWSFEVQKVLLVDGEVCFRSDAPALAGYELIAEKLTAELTQSGDGFTFIAMSDLRRRGERSAEIGPLRLRGEIRGITDLRRITDAPIDAKASLGQLLHADITTTSIRSRSASLAFVGQLDLARLPDLLPPALTSRLRLSGAGTAEIAGRAKHDPSHGVQIDELTLRAAEITFGP